MSVTLNFCTQEKTIQLSEKEFLDLHNAVTFVLNGKGRCHKSFGNIRVEASGNLSAFTTEKKQTIETDC